MSKVQSYLDKDTLKRLHLFMEMEGIKSEHEALQRLIKKGLETELKGESGQTKLPVISLTKEEGVRLA